MAVNGQSQVLQEISDPISLYTKKKLQIDVIITRGEYETVKEGYRKCHHNQLSQCHHNQLNQTQIKNRRDNDRQDRKRVIKHSPTEPSDIRRSE